MTGDDGRTKLIRDDESYPATQAVADPGMWTNRTITHASKHLTTPRHGFNYALNLSIMSARCIAGAKAL